MPTIVHYQFRDNSDRVWSRLWENETLIECPAPKILLIGLGRLSWSLWVESELDTTQGDLGKMGAAVRHRAGSAARESL